MSNYDKLTRIWSGPDLMPLYNPRISVGQIVYSALRRSLNDVGQISHEDGYELKNSEILRDSVRVSLNFRKLGLQEGDVLGLVSGNHRHVAAIAFGALLNGLPINGLNPMFEREAIKSMFSITQPKFVICEDVNYLAIKGVLGELKNPAPLYVLDRKGHQPREWKSASDLLVEHPAEQGFIPPKISDGEQLSAFILCSSGTTGPPKAISVSHVLLAYLIQERRDSPPDSRYFTFSSIAYMSGIITLLKTTVGNLVRLISDQHFSAQLFLEVLRKHKLGILVVTPIQLQLLGLLEEFDAALLESVDTIVVGGYACPQDLQQRVKVPLHIVYGLAETGTLAMNDRLLIGTKIKIINGNGENLGPGECGEICAQARFPFLGYYGNEEGTKAIVKDGYVHTGDIGWMDENGFLHIVDRKKEIFKYSSFDVIPAELEDKLSVLEGVGVICVVAVPNKTYINYPAAVIVRSAGSELTDEDVHKFAQAKLLNHQWLRGGVYIIEEMPLNISGKIARREVVKLAIKLYEKNSDIAYNY